VTILEDNSDRRYGGGVERHIQTILTMGVAALLAWQLTTIEEMRVELAILTGRVDALAVRVDEAASDRYRTVDATRDFALRDQVVEGLNYRIKRVEAICAAQKESSN
jgi:hypothetical protein